MVNVETERNLNRAFHSINAEMIGMQRADGGHTKDPIYQMLNRTKDSIYRALFNIEMIKEEERFRNAEKEDLKYEV